MPPPAWVKDLSTWLDGSELLDGLPFASQGKSVVQAMAGDADGAVRTQENFTRRCPVISQVRQHMEQSSGDTEAAGRTQSEFQKSMSEVGAALAVGAQTANTAINRFQESEVGCEVTRRAEDATRRAFEAAERLAQQLSQTNLGRNFTNLLERIEARHSSGNGRGMGYAGEQFVSSRDLSDYTLLTPVAAAQSGEQCSCCMEAFREGDMMRVLPCFHALHPDCADKWLYSNPVCPICRCDIRTSLLRHDAGAG